MIPYFLRKPTIQDVAMPWFHIPIFSVEIGAISPPLVVGHWCYSSVLIISGFPCWWDAKKGGPCLSLLRHVPRYRSGLYFFNDEQRRIFEASAWIPQDLRFLWRSEIPKSPWVSILSHGLIFGCFGGTPHDHPWPIGNLQIGSIKAAKMGMWLGFWQVHVRPLPAKHGEKTSFGIIQDIGRAGFAEEFVLIQKTGTNP